MSIVLRTYLKARNNILSAGNVVISPCSGPANHFRSCSDDKGSPQFSNSTIMIEHGYNVQELPVVVKKLKDLAEIDVKHSSEPNKAASDSNNYHLIREEFGQCMDLRDVFSLLSKCTQITPNIALGAMERIYDIEKNPSPLQIESAHINLAKGAILDKLLKVVMKTEDTQTILNILNTVSSFMEPYKNQFCDELLLRVIDDKLSIEQLCDFLAFLIKNKSVTKYSDIIDKLWVGFVAQEGNINETNIINIFNIVHGLKISKKTVFTLLEQKLADIWPKISVPAMQTILNISIQEKHFSMQSFAVIGRWFNTNIHALDEDSLLDIISKLTRLKYTDDQVEKAVEKYMKLKGVRVKSYVLIVGILNYCMQFQIRNEIVLNACSEFVISQGNFVPQSFLKSLIYPFGYLYFEPLNINFWSKAEEILYYKFEKIAANDLCSIILSFIYVGKYPLKIVKNIFNPEYVIRINDTETMKKLHLVDTALSLECPEYAGPLLPKDQWIKPAVQDIRIKNILSKTIESFSVVAGSSDNVSIAVSIPHFCSDETYLLDVMIHHTKLGNQEFNWKTKSSKDENVAILIHLPDHFCSDNEQLVGPQIMRKKHFKMLGFKVVSLKYSLLSQFYTSYNINGLKKYIYDSINNTESGI